MFHSLLKMFHDGIILTRNNEGEDTKKVNGENGEEIIYRNKRLEKIFDVQIQKEVTLVNGSPSATGVNGTGVKELVNENLI